MAERYSFDAIALQQGVAFGLLGGTAAGLIAGNLAYWMTLGSLTGFAIACGTHGTQTDDDPPTEEPR